MLVSRDDFRCYGLVQLIEGGMVKLVTAAFILFAAATVAYSEPLPVPMPERGGSCPHGYFRSAGFCVPREGAEDAVPQRNGSCPHGWTASGSFCLRSGQRHECYHGLSRCF